MKLIVKVAYLDESQEGKYYERLYFLQQKNENALEGEEENIEKRERESITVTYTTK